MLALIAPRGVKTQVDRMAKFWVLYWGNTYYISNIRAFLPVLPENQLACRKKKKKAFMYFSHILTRNYFICFAYTIPEYPKVRITNANSLYFNLRPSCLLTKQS